MKKTIFSLALLALIAASCNDHTDITDPNGKEMISFSMTAQGGSASSVSVTRAGFDQATTQIAARFVSNDGTNYRHTVTKLNAQKDNDANGGANWSSYSTVDYPDNDSKRYWDDAFGRDAKISIYAIAVPNKTDVQNGTSNTALVDLLNNDGTAVNTTTNPKWKTTKQDENSVTWSVESSAQTMDKIAEEDLCYTNNIQPEVTLNSGDLKYTRGKDGVRVWGKYATDYSSYIDANGYPMYYYVATPTAPSTDHYPTLDDGMLTFRLTNPSAGAGSPGHFDKGHMIFHHALTRITVNLQKDVSDDGGFTGTATDNTDFAFATGDLIHLLGMPYTGTLDIKTGAWSNTTPKDDIKMATTAAAASMNYTNIAQVIPGYELEKTSNSNVLKFTLSDNTYYITQAQLFKALDEGTVGTTNNKDVTDHNGNPLVTVTNNKITLEQGKNYVFTIKVKKTKIQSITATLVPWIEVTGSTAEAGNNYVKINLHDKMNTACKYFDLYRMNDDATNIYSPENSGLNGGTDWVQNYNYYGTAGTANTQNYVDKAEFTSTSPDGNGKWATKWFWPSNKSFYHFRTVNKDLSIQANTTTDQDYFNIFSGPVYDYIDADPGNSITGRTVMATAVNEFDKVNDFHWGAPFKSAATLTYDKTYGWSAADPKDGQIYPAIGATTMDINMIEHHMMAKVNFVLHTARTSTSSTELPADQWVHLKSTGGDNSGIATRVIMNNFYGTGKVTMGSGLVTPTGSLINSELPIPGLSLTASSYNNSNELTGATVSTGYFAHADTVTKAYSYRVVPQALYRGDNTTAAQANLNNYIGLKFVTADDNQYYVVQKLSEVIAKTVTNVTANKNEQAQGAKIEFWYPGYEYTYHIYINKTGIAAVTCTVVDWITVTGKPFDITLED